MKCFYHNDRDAVAACQDCGVGLCPDCAAKYKPALCPDCAQKRMRQNELEQQRIKESHLKKVEADFNSVMIRGAIVAAIFIALGLIICIVFGDFSSFIAFVVTAIFGFFASFSWDMWAEMRANFNETNPAARFFFFILRCILSFICGIPCCIIAIIKYIKGKEQNRNM